MEEGSTKVYNYHHGKVFLRRVWGVYLYPWAEFCHLSRRGKVIPGFQSPGYFVYDNLTDWSMNDGWVNLIRNKPCSLYLATRRYIP